MNSLWRSRTPYLGFFNKRSSCRFSAVTAASKPFKFPCQLSTMASVTAMQKSNRLRAAFVDKEGPSYGIWQMLPGTNVSRALARANPDWIMVDCEHGNIDDAAMHELIPVIAASGVSPIVRIPDLQSWMIKSKPPVFASKPTSCTKLCTRGAGCRCAWGERSPIVSADQADDADQLWCRFWSL